MISIFHKEATGVEFHSSSHKATFCFMVNIIITNRDFPKAVLKKKTVILDSQIKEDISQGNYYRRTCLVTCSTSKTCLVTHSTCLTSRSTRLPTRSTRMTTRSTHSNSQYSIFHSQYSSVYSQYLSVRSQYSSGHSSVHSQYSSVHLQYLFVHSQYSQYYRQVFL